MALPKISIPIYELKLLSNGNTVQYRPYLHKEEKILLLAMESQETKEMVNATKQIVNNCLITKINIDNLPTFDIDYLFLNMRARAIGNKIEQLFICGNEVDGVKCGNEMTVDINISDITLTDMPPTTAFVIQLDGKVGIRLKYPRFKTYSSENETELNEEILLECIDSIYDEKQSYKVSEQPVEEIREFIDNLTESQFQKIQDFYDSIPTLMFKKKYTCQKCNFEHDLEVSNPLSFF